MFREPLRRDPLVICWAVAMSFAAFVALSNNTSWSGHLQADRVAGFIKDLAEAFLWSFLLLLLAAWLRARRWAATGRKGPRAHQARKSAANQARVPQQDDGLVTDMCW